jgi:hypothetical protein
MGQVVQLGAGQQASSSAFVRGSISRCAGLSTVPRELEKRRSAFLAELEPQLPPPRGSKWLRPLGIWGVLLSDPDGPPKLLCPYPERQSSALVSIAKLGTLKKPWEVVITC